MAKKSRKRCKICNKLFTPQYTTTQSTCSVQHAIEYSQLRKASNKAKLNIMRNEKMNIDKLGVAIMTTVKHFNKYIGIRDYGKPCISCGKPWNNRFEAGHAYSAGKFNAIRFNFDCVNGQCWTCNNSKEGNYDEYHLRLPGRIGEERATALANRARIAQIVPYTWTRHELTAIRKEVSLRMKQLKNK